MAINVTKMPSFKRLLKALNTTDEEIVSVSTSFIVGIQKRTQQGRDANNRTFDRYNDDYKHYRNKNGRTSKVNLTFHGHMLHAMKVKKYRNGAMIYFKDKENDKAYYNHESMGREFFALDSDQGNYMMKRLGTFIAKGLK